MPCLSLQFNPTIGPLIEVIVFPHGQAAGQLASARAANAPQAFTTHNLLVDTGADGTCISQTLAQSVGLTPIGIQTVHGVSGPAQHNQYLIDLVIPFGQMLFTVPNLTVMEFASANPNYFGLLGRDVICRGQLSISFDNTYRFCL